MNDLSLIDRFALVVNPKWAYNRIAWKQGVQQIRNYDAGSGGRLNGNWTRVNASAQQTDRPFRDAIRARARDLERNSDLAESIVLAYERNVVGRGFKLQALPKTASGEDDEALEAKIEKLWAEWSRKENCDVTRQQSLTEMLIMTIRRLRYDGGILFIKVFDDEGVLPFKLQAREVDELDTSIITPPNKESKNVVIDGIEYNSYHRPVAYYFKKYSADGFWQGKSDRIEAKRVIYLWEKRRPTQIREMSPIANSLSRIRDTNEYMEAVSVQARILACLSVFIKKINPSANSFGRAAGKQDEQSGYKQSSIVPGMIHYLQPGEEAQAINPAGQSQNARDYLAFMQRITGSGQGLSYESVSRDMSNSNYSSARQGLIEDKRTYQRWQDYLIEHFLNEVYNEFLVASVLSGKLNIKDFFQNRERYTMHKFIPCGWDWIDPLKEVKAYQTALETGQTSLSEITANKGSDWKEILDQRAKEMKYAKSIGISLSNEKGGNISEKPTTKK